MSKKEEDEAKKGEQAEKEDAPKHKKGEIKLGPVTQIRYNIDKQAHEHLDASGHLVKSVPLDAAVGAEK